MSPVRSYSLPLLSLLGWMPFPPALTWVHTMPPGRTARCRASLCDPPPPHAPTWVHTIPPGRTARCRARKKGSSNSTSAGPTGSDESTMMTSKELSAASWTYLMPSQMCSVTRGSLKPTDIWRGEERGGEGGISSLSVTDVQLHTGVIEGHNIRTPTLYRTWGRNFLATSGTILFIRHKGVAE